MSGPGWLPDPDERLTMALVRLRDNAAEERQMSTRTMNAILAILLSEIDAVDAAEEESDV